MLAVYQANAMGRPQWARWFTDRGVPVFALAAGSKDTRYGTHGHLDGTLDTAVIDHWFTENPQYNLGIVPGQLPDGRYLWVLDLDTKHGKNGVRVFQDWCKAHGLDAQALAQSTLAIRTPTGGQHLYLISERPVRHGAGVMGKDSGVDTRSNGKGYVVGPGSLVGQKRYTVEHMAEEFAIAPTAFCEALGYDSSPRATVPAASTAPLPNVDQDRAAARVVDFLKTAPIALEGAAGDDTTYKVICRVKDLGVDQAMCFQLMAEQWNDRCQPPWSDADLLEKVRNAYKYGQAPVGVAAPEVEFSTPVESDDPTTPKTLHPFDELNKTYGYIKSGSHIVRETTDADRRFKLERLTIPQFHTQLAPSKMEAGGKIRQLSDLWLHSKDRREYEGYVFMPRQDTPAGWYNLWRGFSRKAAATGDHPAVKSWVDHIRQNVCGGDPALARWFLSYCAHLIQTPSDKPLVAPVLVGEKGTGKTIVFEILGELLGSHYFLTANRRYLAGNFNGHLENCLLLVLDEAFWSGSKDVEGILKDLVTGTRHAIEHKGHAPYTVANKTRVVILSNSEWVVPASHDERRFAVFTVGTGRKQDRDFFRAMVEGMVAGGYEALLRYLLDYDLDLDGVDLNEAPKTEGLRAQQDRSLDPLPEWWLSCLTDGTIHGGPFEGWPSELSCGDFRSAFRRHCQERNITGRIPSDIGIGKLLKAFAPGIRKRQLSTEGRPRGYEIPPLDQARQEWDAHCPPGRVWE